MNKWLIVGVAVVIVIALAFWQFAPKSSSTSSISSSTLQTQTSSTTSPSATSATSTTSHTQSTQSASAPGLLSLVKGDTVTSWNFKSAYTGNPDLMQKAQEEIARLAHLIGSGTYTNYDLYMSIANQYDLLGDGAQEVVYLKKALAIDSTTTGLAWYNAGQLFLKLGAYGTARAAFEKAVAAESTLQYHQALLDFLRQYYPNDSVAIQQEWKVVLGASSTSAQ